MGRADGLHRRPNKVGGIWYFGYRGFDGKWHEVSTRTTKYADAVQAKTTLLTTLTRSDKSSLDYGRLSLTEAINLWLRGREGKVSDRTLQSYKALAMMPKSIIGGIRLKEFAVENIEYFQAMRQKDGLRGRSINMETDIIRMTLKRFNYWDRVAEKFEKLNEDDSELGKALTREQTEHMLRIGGQDISRRKILLTAKVLLSTGMRTCELKQLRLGQIDLAGSKLYVRRETTKRKTSARTVPLNWEARAALGELLRESWQRGATKPEHFLLPRKNAGGWTADKYQVSFRTSWRTWMKDANLSSFRLHDLRHTFITRCAEAGIPLEITRSIVGHMSNRMTRYYTHIHQDAKLSAVQSIDFLENAGQLRLEGL